MRKIILSLLTFLVITGGALGYTAAQGVWTPPPVQRVLPGVITNFPGPIQNIAAGDIWHLPENAVKTRFEGRLVEPLQVGIYHVTARRMDLAGHKFCTAPENGATPFDNDNQGKATAIVAYPFPTPPACSGLGCFPTLTIVKNGVTSYNPSSWALDTGLAAFVVSFNVSVKPNDVLELKIHHQLGVTSIDPVQHKLALVVDMNCP